MFTFTWFTVSILNWGIKNNEMRNKVKGRYDTSVSRLVSGFLVSIKHFACHYLNTFYCLVILFNKYPLFKKHSMANVNTCRLGRSSISVCVVCVIYSVQKHKTNTNIKVE